MHNFFAVNKYRIYTYYYIPLAKEDSNIQSEPVVLSLQKNVFERLSEFVYYGEYMQTLKSSQLIISLYL